METKEDIIKKIAQHIADAESIIFFTGAGCSVPSGIPDFRSPGGLWDKYNPLEVATLRAFRKNTEKVWEFFRELYQNFGEAEPNKIHCVITDIQKLIGEKKVHIATQNIDGLHQKSGSKNVFELHGTPEMMHCFRCGYEEEIILDKHLSELPYPTCPKCKKALKPKVVLFEEPLDMDILKPALKIARKSDIAIGVATSLEVFPAADVLLSPPPSTKKALFNLTPTYYDRLIHYRVRGDATETLPILYENVKGIMENK
ncbi:MAG: SIR2 family NAD-dependent protein deacylase [Candidatus Heimdallarchaeaceae archaeon]|jgi:NAD-dependent deacetylase